MTNEQFTAITYPETWPPPLLPPHPSHRYGDVPFVGRVFNYFQWRHYSREHQRHVLDPIANEIIHQLESRPVDGPWPTDKRQREIVKHISDAVCLEKGLTDSPALHPDDPFPLLFWGPFDDITPMIVRMDCRDKLKLEMPDELFLNAWNQEWTIKQFVLEALSSTIPEAAPAG